MKIGLIRETKVPEDNRVALSPLQVHSLSREFSQHSFVVQSSNIRAYPDDEYTALGVDVVEDVSDCDILFGIKEANLDSLIPNKHYFFFGHIAKMQEYNKPLLKKMMDLNITFSDYEYLVDDNGDRVCAFGWWAGVVGTYNTLRAYGLKTGRFILEKPDRKFTLDLLMKRLKSIDMPAVKIILTGNGRVSHGVQYVLNEIGITRVSVEEFLKVEQIGPCYCVAGIDALVKKENCDCKFDLSDFNNHPECYKSNFSRFYEVADIMISGHFWSPNNPVYLTENDLNSEKNRIRVIGDITCDIKGSIKSTLRSSTHESPFYDYNPQTCKEEPAFSSPNNITVMAVDTCPNALAIDTSAYFGKMLIKYVFEPMLSGNILENSIIQRSTILDHGHLTPKFSYLEDFAK